MKFSYSLVGDKVDTLEQGLTKEEAIAKARLYAKSGETVAIQIDHEDGRIEYLNPDGTVTENSGVMWMNEAHPHLVHIKAVVWYEDDEAGQSQAHAKHFSIGDWDEVNAFLEEMQGKEGVFAVRCYELDIVSSKVPEEEIIAHLDAIGHVRWGHEWSFWKSWEGWNPNQCN